MTKMALQMKAGASQLTSAQSRAAFVAPMAMPRGTAARVPQQAMPFTAAVHSGVQPIAQHSRRSCFIPRLVLHPTPIHRPCACSVFKPRMQQCAPWAAPGGRSDVRGSCHCG